jgi:hypothetical protein
LVAGGAFVVEAVVVEAPAEMRVVSPAPATAVVGAADTSATASNAKPEARREQFKMCDSWSTRTAECWLQLILHMSAVRGLMLRLDAGSGSKQPTGKHQPNNSHALHAVLRNDVGGVGGVLHNGAGGSVLKSETFCCCCKLSPFLFWRLLLGPVESELLDVEATGTCE